MRTSRDPAELVAGVPLIVVVPGLVEVAKRAGLPIALSGIAASVIATVLLALGDLALGIGPEDTGGLEMPARWLLDGIIFGLTGSGL